MTERPAYLDSLEQDIAYFREAIREAAASILDDEISAYPVFVFFTSHFPIGERILDREELHTSWSVNATTAEELIRDGVIPLDKAKFFVAQYKPAREYMCLLVVPEGATPNFIFVPY